MLTVASCQFSVEAEISHNRDCVLAQIDLAADRGARVAHFCETALTGYAGVDIPDTQGIDWNELHDATQAICQAAAKRGIWVLLGSTHRLTGGHLPHNCVYVISDQGQVVDRYDKRFCTGLLKPSPELDLAYYTPGNRSVTFGVDGYKCGVLICYDYRFPELYRDLKRQGVDVVFQSFHNARRDLQMHETGNIWKEIVPATMMCHAATNYFWISAVNSTARYSSWPSFFVRPDGRIAGRLADHETSVLISQVAPSPDIWDAPGPWRERALCGTLHSGELLDDPRSSDRTCY
ncbi:MAG: carbon-nitrogen hydrolase family protein [Pirellulales bacterium]